MDWLRADVSQATSIARLIPSPSYLRAARKWVLLYLFPNLQDYYNNRRVHYIRLKMKVLYVFEEVIAKFNQFTVNITMFFL